MKTHQKCAVPQEGTDTLRLLVLVPHRDARLLLRVWSGALFATGVQGAWSFPWAAPLAILSRPFSAGELKHCAKTLREQSLAGTNDGKVTTGQAASAAFPENLLYGGAAVYGPVLDITIPAEAFVSDAAGKIAYRFSPQVLGCALVYGSGPAGSDQVPPPRLSFRAAALANMIYRPVAREDGGPCEGGCSFEWKIGKLYWLPPVKRYRPPWKKE